MATYCGIKGTRVIWHGEWADPEIEYKGKLYSYPLIEDLFWSDFTKDFNTEKDKGFDYCYKKFKKEHSGTNIAQGNYAESKQCQADFKRFVKLHEYNFEDYAEYAELNGIGKTKRNKKSMATRRKSTKRKSCRLSGEGDKTTLRKSTADKQNKGSLAKWTAGRANKKLTKKVSEKDCATIIKAFVETITDDVKNGTTVVVPKLATFVAKKRNCYNPKKGTTMSIRAISTHLSKSFKDSVRGKK